MPQASATPRAAAAATAGLGRIIRIQGRAEDLVEGLRTSTELGRIGFADGNGTTALETLDSQRVAFGDVVLVDRRTERRAQTGGFLQILVGDGQTVQRASFDATRQHRICGIGQGERVVVRDARDDSIHERVDTLNLREVRLHDLAGGKRACLQTTSQISCRHEAQIVRHITLPQLARSQSGAHCSISWENAMR